MCSPTRTHPMVRQGCRALRSGCDRRLLGRRSAARESNRAKHTTSVRYSLVTIPYSLKITIDCHSQCAHWLRNDMDESACTRRAQWSRPTEGLRRTARRARRPRRADRVSGGQYRRTNLCRFGSSAAGTCPRPTIQIRAQRAHHSHSPLVLSP